MSRNENGKAQPPSEKSSFTQRCSLLSRYLREKGSFGNIDLGLVRKSESDLVLSGKSDPQGTQSVMQKAEEQTEIKPFDFFQNVVTKGEPSNSSGGKVKEANYLSGSEPGSSSSQLTIFFGGKVLVYNEFPEDKAKEIMEVAKQVDPVTEVINLQTQIKVENNNNVIDNKSNMALPDLNEPTNSADINQQQQQNQVVERIARRASLHRFFAKRKDRAVARAPYQVNQNAGHYPPKPDKLPAQPLEQGQSSRRPNNPVAQPKLEGDNDTVMEVEEGQCSRDLELKL